MRCAVKSCNNNNRKKPCTISFFNFPTDSILTKQWKKFCGRERKMNIKTSQICMEHFQPEDFENSLEYELGFTKRRRLKSDAVPSIRKVSATTNKDDKGRAKRLQKRENRKIVEMLINEDNADKLDDVSDTSEQQIKTEVFMDQHIQSVPEINPLENLLKNTRENNQLQSLKMELAQLRKENSSLKETSKNQVAEIRALKAKLEKDWNAYKYNLDSLRARLMRATYELGNLEEKLLGIFTKHQIAKFKTGLKRTKWTVEDITQAKDLYAASSKLYKLLYRKQFPLPAVRTLQAWSQKVDIAPGVLEPVTK